MGLADTGIILSYENDISKKEMLLLSVVIDLC